jgi:hypothetical protein
MATAIADGLVTLFISKPQNPKLKLVSSHNDS